MTLISSLNQSVTMPQQSLDPRVALLGSCMLGCLGNRKRMAKSHASMNSIDRTLQDALAAFNSRNFAEAERSFKAVLKRQPSHVQALNLLTIVLMSLERFPEAEPFIARAVALYPNSDVSFYNYGLILKRLNKPLLALQQFDNAIRLNPKISETWNNRGTIHNDLKQYQRAIDDFDRAIALNGGYAEAYANKARPLQELGRFDEAQTAYEKALALNPAFAETWVHFGDLLRALGRNDEALAAYDKAADIRPDLAAAWLGRGDVFFARGDHRGALAAYDHVVALRADIAEAWLGRGNACAFLGAREEALVSFDKAIAIKPELAGAWLGRGNILVELRKFDEADRAYTKVLGLAPDLAEAWLGRGNVLKAIRSFDAAGASYHRALELKPDLAEAWLGRGSILEAHHLDQALEAYDKALSLKPELVEAWHARGTTLCKLGKHGDGVLAYDRALELKPDFAEAWQGRGNILLHESRAPEALAAYDKALSIKPALADAISDKIFVLDFVTSAGFEVQQRARDYWWDQIGAPIAKRLSAPHANVRDPNRKLRIGYVSADLREHSAALSFKPMMLNHNKAEFHITCYSMTIFTDSITREFERAVDQWHEVVQLSDDAFHDLVRKDQIDILVDLSGHTAGHRLEVFAGKPAPVQISIGATGTGLKTIDYIFADPVICPPAVRHFFAEKFFDLPSIMTIEALPEQLEIFPAPVLSKGYITFGMFNRISKISDEAVVLWSRILHAIPSARLFIKHFALDDPSLRSRQLERFAAHGIGSDRIDMAGSTSRKEHLTAFKDVDISFDPFPHNGGISTLDSLQVGVPVIALLGNAPTSRAAGSILSSVGLGDWVAETTDDYLSIATKFAAMPDHLGQLRYALPPMLAASAVGNAAIYTKAVERAYRKIWADYCQSGNG
jgi:predicted O-linked N-acetylglucosamine transferase (SPINDLY family)